MSEQIPPSIKHLKRPYQSHASGEDHSDGNWLVSYADMMTLLVGFFVILLSFSKIDDEVFEKFKEVVAKEFGGSYQVPYGELGDRIKKILEKQGVANQFAVKQTPLGVEISFLGAVFFDTGSADIKPEAQSLMNTLLPVLKQEAGQFQVIVEGHTDDVPVGNKSRFLNNWELSGIRASKVIGLFEQYGFTKSVLTSVGYADGRPLFPNRNASGDPLEENQAKNRRVVIKLIHQGEGLMGKPEEKGKT
jgi:chemotaxis protein MotB